MEHIAVESSQIASIAHDQDTSSMQVLFRRGGLYEYENVDFEEFTAVRNPSAAFGNSVGKAFAGLIKGKKVFKKLEGSSWPTQQSEPADQPVVEAAPVENNPKVEEVSKQTVELVQQAKTIAVVDQSTQVKASEMLLTIAQMRKQVADTFKPMKDAAFKTHRTICDQEKSIDAPLFEAERALKNGIGNFIQEQQRIARQIEDEQRRIAKEEADRKAKEESERLALEDAIALEAQGDTKAAEAVLANPTPVVPQYVAPAPVAAQVAQVSGVTTRTGWDFRIVDESRIPREYLTINESAIREVGKRTNGKVNIPGVEFFPKTVVASSRRG